MRENMNRVLSGVLFVVCLIVVAILSIQLSLGFPSLITFEGTVVFGLVGVILALLFVGLQIGSRKSG